MDRGDIGLFVDVNITGVFRNAFITMQYNDSDVAGIDEDTLRMYYWNEIANGWIIIEDSGVWANNNTVWANVTHLTIFAPMGEKITEGAPSTEEIIPTTNWTLYIGTFAAIIMVIGVTVAVLHKRKK